LPSAVEQRREISALREDQDVLFNHLRTITEGIKELKPSTASSLPEELQSTAAAFRRHNVHGLTFFCNDF